MKKNFPRPLQDTLAVLDIGSSKVICCIGRVDSKGKLRVIGVGHQLSRGMKSGSIIDMEALEVAILNAVHSAEEMAGETIRSIYVNISGKHLHSQNVEVAVSIAGHAVDQADIKRVLTQARMAKPIPGVDVIHTIPTKFAIDLNRGIRDPKGMFGQRLGVAVHLLLAEEASIRNLMTCVSRCHLDLDGIVSTALASGLSALVEDEMDLGVTIIDIGGGSTTMGTFFEGNLVHADCVPLGGSHVTSDIARGLSTTLAHAERLKTLHGSAMVTQNDNREMIIVPQMGEANQTHPNQIPRAHLVSIIQARMEEIFDHVRHKLDQQGLQSFIGRRLVLTGGGSNLAGIRDLAAHTLTKSVRLGRPNRLEGLKEAQDDPALACCIGMLQYASVDHRTDKRYGGASTQSDVGFFKKISTWFKQKD